MFKFSAKAHVAFGLCSLLVSLLLVAAFLGLVPDRQAAVRDGRAALAETLAAVTTRAVAKNELTDLRDTFEFVVKRNADLGSIALRRHDGQLALIAGDHAAWSNIASDYSVESQIKVPILDGTKVWGFLELRYQPSPHSLLPLVLGHPWLRLIGGVAFAALLTFYLYLGKALKHLDPSQAIPGRVRAALDTLVEGLLVLDRKGQIVLANQAFTDFVGVAADALLGQSAAALQWRDSAGQPLADALPWTVGLEAGVANQDTTLTLIGANTERRTFQVNCSPILGSAGRTNGVLVSLDDVTQIEASKTALECARREAEDANLSKSLFLANMSHEIRTPMNSILGFTELLQRGLVTDPVKARKYLDTIYSSGSYLLKVVNDILDLSKVESGHIEIEQIPCHAHTIIQEVVQVLGIKAAEKGIALEFEIAGEVPEQIVSDPVRVRQIVTNLLGNAIKFTAAGSVRAVLSMTSTQLGPRLAIAVVDTGIGIAADKLAAIFDPFVQADSSVTRRFGGTGLGLAISQRYARALGGEVEVRSELGRGTTFTVTLATGPLDGVRRLSQTDLRSDNAPAVNELETWEFPPARVLVVDDGAENRELLQVLLGEYGLQVDEAENGAIAVERASATDYALVLMDVQMPVMDGYTAARTLRAHGVTIPIIALTANAMKGYEREALDAGYSTLATKPVDIPALLSLLAEYLGGRRVSPRESAQREAMTPAPAPDAETAVVSRLAASPRLHAAIGKFVVRLPQQLDAMVGALVASDFSELAGLAHWLKGAGGTVGFDALTEPATQLEMAARGADLAHAEQILAILKNLAKRLEVPATAARAAVNA